MLEIACNRRVFDLIIENTLLKTQYEERKRIICSTVTPPPKNNRGIQKQDCIFPTDGGFKDGMGKLKVNIRD